MGETAASNPALQVSVSFGRFENDSLSWEKWSAFSPNKYLEEVEKCATPGSVAQKKAYFEAHYKKIAARKAELLGQEKQTDDDPVRSEDRDGENLGGICRTDAEFDVSNSPNSIEGVKTEAHSFGEISGTHVDFLEQDTAVSRDYQVSFVDGEGKQLESISDSSRVDKPEEGNSPTFEAEDEKESSHKLDNEVGKASEVEARDVELEQSKESKVTSGIGKNDAAKTKNNPVLLASKANQIFTPRSSSPSTSPTKNSTKIATPESVAQRKAYFEAHYKKIAASRAELLGQGKLTDSDPLRSEDQDGENLSGVCMTDTEFDVSNSPNFIRVVKHESHSFGEISKTHVDILEDIAVSRDHQISLINEENKQLGSRLYSSQVDKPEAEKSLTIEAEDVKKSSNNLENEVGKASDVEAKGVKLLRSKESKVTSGNVKNNAVKTKKNLVLPACKANQISTPRSSRPPATPAKTLAPASSTKKGNSPSFSAGKSASTGEKKRIANKSLHMSLSLGPSKLDLAPPPTMRKSFIMEKMGDKEIVKRAFKTFQNINLPRTPDEDRSLVKRQVPSSGTETRVQTSMAVGKQNGRPTKVDSINKISGNAVRTSIGLKSDMRAEKGKEFPKKIEEKPYAIEAERVLQSKLKKERKEAETKKVKHNFKATPLPAFYGGQKVSKSRSGKGDDKPENPR